VTAGLLLHTQPQPGFTGLINLAGLHGLRNRAIDHLNQAETQRQEDCGHPADHAKGSLRSMPSVAASPPEGETVNAPACTDVPIRGRP
jgi:hypothetical protein